MLLSGLQITSPHRRLPGAPASASVRCYCNGIAEIRLDGAVTRVENVAPGSYRMEVLDGAGKVEQAHPVVVIEGQTTSVDATK